MKVKMKWNVTGIFMLNGKQLLNKTGVCLISGW